MNATDNEMHAAYCEGTLRELLKNAQSPPQFDPAIPKQIKKELEEMRPKMLAEFAQKRQRFLDYLIATGAIAGANRGDTIAGIIIATNRGMADVQACKEITKNCSETYLGKWGEPLKNDNKSIMMNMQCVNANPSCAKTDKCLLSDALPF